MANLLDMKYPKPHGDKLRALASNSKLPPSDHPRVWSAINRYEVWLEELAKTEGAGEELVERLVASLNRYKRSIDLDLVFDSDNDFLYRQKGQLKLDNTVLEEFLPWLVGRVYADRITGLGLHLGPINAFSQVRFEATLLEPLPGGGMTVRSKDHDFALALPLFLKASHDENFVKARTAQSHLAYVAAEIKTNLDKTMFQEASATAHDLKLALPTSQYYLLCEWLDMTPISTAVTAIEEVVVLRKARRMSADVRKQYSTAAGRAKSRDGFARYLDDHPLTAEAFGRFLSHLKPLLNHEGENEVSVLERGWF